MQKSNQTQLVKRVAKEPLENAAWRSISDAYRTVYSYVISDLRKYGLTPPQYGVLRAIGTSGTGRLAMSEIGKQMIVTFANITTIVDNLEKRSYVRRVRDSSDRRVVEVKLTPTGSRLFKKIYHAHRKQVAKLMQVLNQTELEDLIVSTDKIKKHAVPRRS